MMQTLDAECLNAFTQLLARPDPTDLPRRACLSVRRRSEPAGDAPSGDPHGVVAAAPSPGRRRGTARIGDTDGSTPSVQTLRRPRTSRTCGESWSARTASNRHRLTVGHSHPLTRATWAVVGVLLMVGAVGAQTVATPSMKDPNAQHARQDAVDARQQPMIRRAVAPPSSDFTTYVEGELVRVSIPSNWRELPGSNAVPFRQRGLLQPRREKKLLHSLPSDGARP